MICLAPRARRALAAGREREWRAPLAQALVAQAAHDAHPRCIGDADDASPVVFDASDCNCVPGTVLWGHNGGNVRYIDTSEVSPCKTYSHMRDYQANAPPVTCKRELLGCGVDSIGIGDLTGLFVTQMFNKRSARLPCSMEVIRAPSMVPFFAW